MRPALAWSVVILVVTVPWWSYQPHPHWARVVWVPFSTPPPLTWPDILGNVLLYVPFGYFLTTPGPRGFSRGSWILAAAAALSSITELSQVYSHGRFPSTTDLLLNLTGTLLGIVIAARRSA